MGLDNYFCQVRPSMLHCSCHEYCHGISCSMQCMIHGRCVLNGWLLQGFLYQNLSLGSFQVILQGVPRAATAEDIERFLSGCSFDASSIQIFMRFLFYFILYYIIEESFPFGKWKISNSNQCLLYAGQCSVTPLGWHQSTFHRRLRQ